MKKRPIAALLVATLAALPAVFEGSALATEGVPASGSHPVWTLETCLGCHGPDESSSLSTRVARPCRTLCASCHEFRDGHHPVGVAIPRAVPAPLLLARDGTNTCVTCHDTSRPRLESSPWVSQSFFERIAHRSRENRTFYLTMRNDKGQLCRNCH